MSNSIIADIKPMRIQLQKDTQYNFCMCGRSQNQPFCDGSHSGTSILPQSFSVDKDKTGLMCTCKASKKLPYCDGSHRFFTAKQIGTELEREDESKTKKENQKVEQSSTTTVRSTVDEPTLEFIHQLAKDGLKTVGKHGEMTSMGVPRNKLPHWDDIQLMTAQMAKKPLLEEVVVGTELIIGPNAKKPLKLSIPLFVSDMSFGALSYEAKIALAKGAELSNTGICSGEGGMLHEEQHENSRYFYEYASGEFGYKDELLKNVQAFHFKGGQGAKTGIGGHLPGSKNIGKISEIRGIPEGEPAISPATFRNLHTVEDFKKFADHVREITGGIPIGFKLSANHIEEDIQFALDASADYIILDGRGGSTGAAPTMFRDHISVPTIAALARARAYLDKQNASGAVTLIIAGGLRVPIDFVKALALGADGIALSNSVIQAIGCVGARMCNTNDCPVGIATQKEELRKHINIEQSAKQLHNFFEASSSLMQMMARACGHDNLAKFNKYDLSTWSKDMAHLSGVKYSGYGEL